MKKSCKNCYLGPNKCLGVFFPECKTCYSQWSLKLSRNEIKIGDVYLTKNGKKATVIAIYDSVFVCTIEGTYSNQWTYDYYGCCYGFRVKKG